MALSWDPLDELVLHYTGILSKPQWTALHPLLLPLPLAHTRALLTGISCSVGRATRALWEAYRLLLADVSPTLTWGSPLLGIPYPESPEGSKCVQTY